MGKKEPNGFSECSVLFRTSWLPLYGGGVSSVELSLPEGAGFRLEKGQQLLMQLHLQNATGKPITSRTAMKLATVDPSTPVLSALALITQRRIRHLPVVANGRLVGIVSIGDLVKHRIERIESEAAAMREYIQSA
jgi:hypothetical protein